MAIHPPLLLALALTLATPAKNAGTDASHAGSSAPLRPWATPWMT